MSGDKKNESSNNRVSISVIIPVYNSAVYLNRTIRCLQEQFFGEIEIIFVNDFSTDNSANIIQHFMKNDERIKLIQNSQHQGAGVCRNSGLKMAIGEYVIFLDSDDYFYPNMFEIAYKRAKQEDADVVVFGREIVDMTLSADEYGILPIKYDVYENRVVCGDDVRISDYSQGAFVPWNKLVRKQLIIENNICFQDLPSNNDIFYSFAVITTAKKIVYVNNVLIRYYKNLPQSLTLERIKKNYLPEAIAKCIEYTQNNLFMSRRYKGVNQYLLKIIKREIASGECDEITEKVRRLIENQNVVLWINNCIKEKIFKNEDIIFLQALRLNQIEGNMTVDKLEALGLARFIEKMHGSNKKVALWGCGRRGKRWLELIEKNKIKIDYVIDENTDMQGEIINGFIVHSYESVKGDIDVILLMIADSVISEQIKEIAKDKAIFEEGEWLENA